MSAHALNSDAAAEALRASELRYRRLFESAKDGILILDAETGIVVDVNPFLTELLGIPREAMLSKKVWELGFLKDLASNERKFAELQEREYVRYENLPLKAADGKPIEVEFVSNVYLMKDHRVIQCNIRDITERKQKAKALYEAQNRAAWLAKLPEESPVPIMRIAADGTVLYSNPAASRLPGWACEVGKSLPQPLLSLIGQAMERGLSLDLDVELGERFYLVSVMPFVQERYANIYGHDITDRKHVEKELREKQHILSESQRLGHVGSWFWNMIGPMTWSEELYQLYGVSADTFVPTVESLVRLIYPDDRPAMQAWINACAAGKRPGELEYRTIRPDGTIRFFRSCGEVVLGDGDKPIHMAGTVQDITDRMHAEAALRESEERFRHAIDATKDGLWEWDIQTDRVFHSPRWSEIIGYSFNDPELPDTFVWWEARIHPDDYNRVTGIVRNCIDKGSSFDVDYRHRHKSGHYRWQNSRGKAVCDESGKVIKIVGCISDITERKLAEETLRASEERFRRTFQHSGSGIVFVSLNFRFLQVNNGFCKMLGYAESDLLGKTVHDVIHSEDRSVSTELERRLLSGETETFQIEKRFLHKDGTVIWGLASYTLIRDSRNKPLHFVSQIQDLSERHRAEEEKKALELQFIQAQKMESVGQLAGGMAHDFNNMLSIIIVNADLAMKQVDSASPLYRDLEAIATAGRRSADLTRQLLAFARKQIVIPKVLDLNDTIAGMLKMLRRLIGEGIDLKWNPGIDLWNVKMDPSQIDQILVNLAINSRDAIPGVGKILIETANVVLDDAFCERHVGSAPGEYALLTINDNGIGMSAEVMEHIFEPFFTTKELGKGTGLGLATVYGVVKQNRGCIDFESMPDKGTTFKIYLPHIDAKTDQTQKPMTTAKARGGKETILLVEDSEPILTMLKRMLERLGYRVLPALTPEHAVDLAEKHGSDIHLLISDVVMPGMNGRELAEKILTMQPGMKCLYMSGYAADVIAVRGTLDEGIYFIHKPFNADEIALTVRNVLDQT